MKPQTINAIISAALKVMIRGAANAGAHVTEAEILEVVSKDQKGATAKRLAELIAIGIDSVVLGAKPVRKMITECENKKTLALFGMS